MIKRIRGVIDVKILGFIISLLVAVGGFIAYNNDYRDTVNKEMASMHVTIATLQECARNTEAKLSTIETKLDRIIERNVRIDYGMREK